MTFGIVPVPLRRELHHCVPNWKQNGITVHEMHSKSKQKFELAQLSA